MPITIPPPAVAKAFNSPTTRHTRRVEIYEADGVTRWNRDTRVRLKGGSVSIDYDRAERRVLDNLVLDNSDNVLVNAPTEFWYDKIIKVYRGVRLAQKKRLPKILVISDKTGTDSMAVQFRLAMVSLGFGDIRINVLAETALDLIGYDMVVSLHATTPASINLVKTALQLGYPVISLGNVNYPVYGTTLATNSNSVGKTFTPTSGYMAPRQITHPLASGWSSFPLPSGSVTFTAPTTTAAFVTGTTTISDHLTGVIAAVVERENYKWLWWAGPVTPDMFSVAQFKNFLLTAFNYMNPVIPILDWECQVGEFMIDSIKEANFPHEVVVTGRDYTKKCQNSKYGVATSFPKGQKLEEIIAGIAGAAGITKRILPGTGVLVARDFFFERGVTRWDAMKEIATAYDYELYFDATGYLVMRPYNDPATTSPVLEIYTGVTGNLASYTKSTNDGRIYNHIIVTGESSDETIPPVYAIARNTDPTSPTSVQNLGERSYEYSSSFITTTAQAQQVANSFLAVHSLEEFELDFESLLFPWLETGDIIGWNDPRPAPGDPRTFLLSNMSIPLALGAMSGGAKRVTNVGTV